MFIIIYTIHWPLLDMHCILYQCMCLVQLAKNCFLYNINNTTTKSTHSCQSIATRDFKSPIATPKKPLKQKCG